MIILLSIKRTGIFFVIQNKFEHATSIMEIA